MGLCKMLKKINQIFLNLLLTTEENFGNIYFADAPKRHTRTLKTEQ